MKRAFKQSSSNKEVQLTSFGGAMLSAQAQAAQQQPASQPQLEQTQISASVVNPAYKELTEKLVWKPKGTRELNDDSNGNADIPSGNIFKYSTKGTYGDLTPTAQKAMKGILLTLGIKKGNDGHYQLGDKKLTPTQAMEQVRQFAKQRSETGVSVATRTFTEEEINKAKNYVANGNYSGRQFFDIEEGKFVLYDKLPSKVKDIIESGETKGIQFSGVFDTDNPFYDIAKSNKGIKDVKGWVSPENIIIAGKKYAVSSSLSDKNKQDINFRELATKVSRANRTGVPVYLGSGRDKEAVVPIGNGLYQLKDLSGNLISPKSFTKEQIALYSQQYNLTPEED